MANNQSLQILRGANNYNPSDIEEKLLDGQLFYSKYNKQLYIGDNANYENKFIKEILPIGAANLVPTSSSALKQLSAAEASGINSVAFGEQTIASGKNAAVFGEYNNASNNAFFTIGDGTAENAKHNALTITKDANGIDKFEFDVKNSGNLTFGKQANMGTSLELSITNKDTNYKALQVMDGNTSLKNKEFDFYIEANPAIVIAEADANISQIPGSTFPLPRIDVNASKVIVRTDKYTEEATAAINLMQDNDLGVSKLTINGFTKFAGDVTVPNYKLTAKNIEAINKITTPNLEATTSIKTPKLEDITSIKTSNVTIGDTADNKIVINSGCITAKSITLDNNVTIVFDSNLDALCFNFI